MQQVKQLLERLYGTTDGEWQTISRYFEIVDMKKDEHFVTQGKVCNAAAFVLEGVVRYYAHQENGDEQTCYFAAEDDFIVDPFSFPALAVATTFNLQLVADCRLAVISTGRHEQLANELPKWPTLYNALVQRAMAEFLNQKIVISYDAGRRYEYFVTNYPQYVQRVPLQYIASYLGIAQPSLSRVRNKMAKKSITSLNN